MPLFYHKYVNYVLAHSVNYVITLYSLPLPLHRTSPSPQPSQSTSIVSPRTITLASLVKGEVLSPKIIRATTGGIASSPSLACTNPLEPTLSLALHQHPCLPCQRRGAVARKNSGDYRRDCFLPHPFRFSDTSVNNPSIVGSASHCNRSSPLHKGAKGDSALPTLPKAALFLENR